MGSLAGKVMVKASSKAASSLSACVFNMSSFDWWCTGSTWRPVPTGSMVNVRTSFDKPCNRNKIVSGDAGRGGRTWVETVLCRATTFLRAPLTYISNRPVRSGVMSG